jgi:hypothetical protein
MLRTYLKDGGTLLMASHDDIFAGASGAEVTTMESLVPAVHGDGTTEDAP